MNFFFPAGVYPPVQHQELRGKAHILVLLLSSILTVVLTVAFELKIGCALLFAAALLTANIVCRKLEPTQCPLTGVIKCKVTRDKGKWGKVFTITIVFLLIMAYSIVWYSDWAIIFQFNCFAVTLLLFLVCFAVTLPLFLVCFSELSVVEEPQINKRGRNKAIKIFKNEDETTEDVTSYHCFVIMATTSTTEETTHK